MSEPVLNSESREGKSGGRDMWFENVVIWIVLYYNNQMMGTWLSMEPLREARGNESHIE